jgi:hypothetical protein
MNSFYTETELKELGFKQFGKSKKCYTELLP